MTHQRIVYFSAILLLGTLFLTSCFSDIDKEPSAYGDAFIKARLNADSTINYNLELFAYSWSEMEEVEVAYESSGARIKLDTFDYKYTYNYQASQEIASSEIPKDGQYFFYITFANGYETATTDFLMAKTLTPPVFNKVYWNEDAKQIELDWDPVEDAQLYGIILLDEEGKVAFESELLEPDLTKLIINQFTYGWYSNKKPTTTSTFTIQLSALLFEPIYSTMDIQCIAINELNTFDWILENDSVAN